MLRTDCSAMLQRCRDNWRGLLSVLGAFLVQLGVGSYHGTFGNLLPYLSSYMKVFTHSTVK